MEPFVYESQGRNQRTIVVVILVYTALIALVLLFGAALWLMALLAVVTLPALWDLYANPSAGLRLDDDRLSWHSGRRQADIPLSEIDHMRFDTRLDFSVRVSAVLHTTKRVRLPYEALPSHKTLESAFHDRGVPVKRHHFSLF